MEPPFRSCARSVLILAIGVGIANAQRFPTTEESSPSVDHGPRLSPRSQFDNFADRFTSPRHDEARDMGAISVQQLRSPLKGRALKRFQKAQEAIRDNKRSEAVTILTDLLDDPSARPYALCVLGAEHLKLAWDDRSFLDRALEELQEGAELNPADAATESNLALALGLKGDVVQAAKHGQKSLQLNPNEPKSRTVLGWVLALAGRNEEAAFHLRIAAKRVQEANSLLEALELAER